MIAIQKQIIRDEQGSPQSVIIPWSQFCELMEELGQDYDGKQWSPQMLAEHTEKMVAENDPVQAARMREEIIAGFYGE